MCREYAAGHRSLRAVLWPHITRPMCLAAPALAGLCRLKRHSRRVAAVRPMHTRRRQAVGEFRRRQTIVSAEGGHNWRR